MLPPSRFYRPVEDGQRTDLSNIDLSNAAFDAPAFEPFNTKHTYSSFPSPVSGRSPTLPTFRIPKYGYFSHDGSPRSPVSSPAELVRPRSSADVRKNSVLRALIQSINYFMGIGVLTLPYALRTTGWFGLVLLVVFGGIMTLTAWLFGGSRRKLYLENFSDHIELACTTKGKVVVSLIFYASMLINAGVFSKLLSDTLSSLTGYDAAPMMATTVLIFMLVTNLSTTSTAPLTRIMSVLGTLSTVVLILALIVAEVLALMRYEASLDSVESVYMHVWTYTATERVYITDLKACLQTLGIFGYCYMGHEVFPAIFHHMQHPQYFTFVVSIAFASMLLCYGTIATLGYLVYGVTASGNIIDNLPPTDVLTVCIKVCIVVTVLSKLTLCAAPLCEGIHEWTRLLLYLTSHWLCPSVRLTSTQEAHTVGTLDTTVQPAKPIVSKYGTYRSPSHVSPWRTKNTLSSQGQPTCSNLTTQELDLNLASDRRKYFNTSFFDVAKEAQAQHSDMNLEDMDLEECTQYETSPLLPTNTTQPKQLMPLLHHDASFTTPITFSGANYNHASVPPYPPAPLAPSVTTLNVTSPVRHKDKELTWSEPLLIIPPIRSPPCGKVLSSSADETTLHDTHVPHLTPGQALVQQEGELVCEGEQSQSLGHSLSALTELLGTASSARVVRTSSSDSTKANTASTIGSTSFKPLLTLLNPEECNKINRNGIHSDSDSSSSLETIEMWYTKDDLPVRTTPAANNNTTTKPLTTQRYTLFDSPDNHTQLSSFTQYQQQLHHQHHQEHINEANVVNRVPTTAGEYAMVTILPVLIRCMIPLVALGIASLFDSFVSMVIFTGGVCGGSVSIVIPTYAYYSIHYRELYTVEKLLLAGVIVVGMAIVVATLLVATF